MEVTSSRNQEAKLKHFSLLFPSASFLFFSFLPSVFLHLFQSQPSFLFFINFSFITFFFSSYLVNFFLFSFIFSTSILSIFLLYFLLFIFLNPYFFFSFFVCNFFEFSFFLFCSSGFYYFLHTQLSFQLNPTILSRPPFFLVFIHFLMLLNFPISFLSSFFS